jgi:hypothetical protein
MTRWTTAVVLVLVPAILLVQPALGDRGVLPKPSVKQRLASLERRTSHLELRVGALAALTLLIRQNKHLDSTAVTFAFANTDASGSATGTAFCPPSSPVVTGGGAQFLTPQVGDSVIYSRPGSEAGTPTSWQAAARKANGSGGTLQVYAVCASQRSN